MNAGHRLRALVFAALLVALADISTADSIRVPGGPESRDVGAFGGAGGRPFRGSCQEGELLVGFNLFSGKALDRIAPLCVRLNAEKTAWVGQPVQVARFGGAGGYSQNIECAANHAIRHLHVYIDRHNMVHHIRFTCQDLVSGEGHNRVQAQSGGEAINDRRFSCPHGEWATGVYGRVGALVDQLGLQCSFLWRECEDYANLAVTHAQLQSADKCGYSGARWDIRKNLHFDWCYRLKGNFDRAHKETDARRKGLQACQKKIAASSQASPKPAEAPPPPLPADPVVTEEAPPPPSTPGPVADTGACPSTGAATITIPEPNLTKLNVREGPGGKVIQTLPEGSEVTVVGACDADQAAGIVAGNVSTSGWCQIDAPIIGCVMAKYLSFETDEQAAGFRR